jgi:hypothetical protein
VFAANLAVNDVVECIALSTFSAVTTEGSSILSTGETGGTKFLREDGDNSSSWQTVPAKFSASGGTVTTYTGYRVHTFTTSGTFTPDVLGTVDYLIVASGGAGAAYVGGAGYQVGNTGANSAFGSIIASGGGGGNGQNADAASNGDGGSGGGAGGGTPGPGDGIDSGSSGSFGTATYQGHNGGTGSGGDPYNAGGGGGAGAVGGNSTSTKNGDGGAGEDQVMGLSAADSYTLLTNAEAGHVVGGARYFAGGGGGGSWITNTPAAIGAGGNGGGGAGGCSAAGTAGTVNTGGGGGGGDSGSGAGGGGGGAGGFRTASSLAVTAETYTVTVGGATSGANANCGAGGSGIVIIRYAT